MHPLVVASSKLRKHLLLPLLCLCFFTCRGYAQQQLSLQRPPEPIRWLPGPATASLGDTAEITIPAGCRFVDPSGARTILNAIKDPVPNNLIGLLFPDSGQWFVILQYANLGYVSDLDKSRMNPAAILKSLRRDITRQNKDASKTGAAPIGEPGWEIPPSFDSTTSTVEYALKAAAADGGSVNYVVNILGRHGVLTATSVHPASAVQDLAAVRELVKGISFKKGERYSDHQPNDHLASFGLAELITTNSYGGAKFSLAQGLSIAFWAGIGLGLLVASGSLATLVLRKQKARYYRMNRPVPEASAVALIGNGHASHENGHPVVEFAHRALPHPNGKHSKHGRRRRKKLFSYHAFYSDMVMNLTSCNYVGPVAPKSNGDSTPETNGNGSTLPPGNLEHPMQDAANLLVAETAKLIQSQQKLIEGQRKLIEEQARLIQEKSNLIDAETRVLEKQSEIAAEQELM